MNSSKNDPSLANKEKLSTIIPNHQDFNFEVWAMAVRKQMMSALADKESIVDPYSQPTLDKLSEEDSND